jgi:GNAT superfamily N-acetyltransferase
MGRHARQNGVGGRIGRVLRPATPADVPEICALIGELADYERLSDEAVADPADVEHWLFGPEPKAQVTIAETDDGAVAGLALWFWTFSTFLGKPGIWLEDLFVRPVHRGHGHGRALLDDLFRRSPGRVEWALLDWNEPAIAFYRSLGAEPVDGWTRYRRTAR